DLHTLAAVGGVPQGTHEVVDVVVVRPDEWTPELALLGLEARDDVPDTLEISLVDVLRAGRQVQVAECEWQCTPLVPQPVQLDEQGERDRAEVEYVVRMTQPQVRGPHRGDTVQVAAPHEPLQRDRTRDVSRRRRSLSPDRETRSEEHTSELQSREKLVCRLLLEKKTK